MTELPAQRRLDAQTTEAYRRARILRTFKSGDVDARNSESQLASTIVDSKPSQRQQPWAC